LDDRGVVPVHRVLVGPDPVEAEEASRERRAKWTSCVGIWRRGSHCRQWSSCSSVEVTRCAASGWR